MRRLGFIPFIVAVCLVFIDRVAVWVVVHSAIWIVPCIVCVPVIVDTAIICCVAIVKIVSVVVIRCVGILFRVIEILGCALRRRIAVIDRREVRSLIFVIVVRAVVIEDLVGIRVRIICSIRCYFDILRGLLG